MGCRIDHNKTWALRAMHEAKMHALNCFLTLTYDKEHLPADYSLHKPHFQDFMKRLRHRLYPGKVRYFMCGEYGGKLGRPHYHAILFGEDFSASRRLWTVNAGNNLYTDSVLSQAWGHGLAVIGEVNYTTCAYVAGYIRKKTRGLHLEEIDPETGLKPYELQDPKTGEIIQRVPEYADMSRNPGLGRSFYERYGHEIRRDDTVVSAGRVMRVPSYYDGLSAQHDPTRLEVIKQHRRAEAKRIQRSLTPERRRLKEDYLRVVVNQHHKEPTHVR
jgi:hypothetical protein